MSDQPPNEPQRAQQPKQGNAEEPTPAQAPPINGPAAPAGPPASAATPAPRGERLIDRDEALLRSVHPNHFKDGRLTMVAFRPTDSDAQLLSVERGSKSTAAESHARRIAAGKQSAGIWPVTVGDVENAGRAAFADPDPGPPPNPAHAVVDFRGLDRKATETAAKQLSVRAGQRGCLFPGPAGSGTTTS